MTDRTGLHVCILRPKSPKGQAWGWGGRRTPSRVYLPIWELPSGSDRLHRPNAESGGMDWDAYQVQSASQALRAFNQSFMDSSNQPASQPSQPFPPTTGPAAATLAPSTLAPRPPKSSSRQLSFLGALGIAKAQSVACSWYSQHRHCPRSSSPRPSLMCNLQPLSSSSFYPSCLSNGYCSPRLVVHLKWDLGRSCSTLEAQKVETSSNRNHFSIARGPCRPSHPHGTEPRPDTTRRHSAMALIPFR